MVLRSCGIALLLCLASLFTADPAWAALLISEVYPAPPSGETEWIELYNSSATAVDLRGWHLEDKLTTPSSIFSFDPQAATTLAGQSYLVISVSASKLNNSADGVSLFDAAGNQVASMNYTSSQTGMSWSITDSGQWILGPATPYAANSQPSPTPSPFPSISLSPSPSPSPSSPPTSSPSPSPTSPPTPSPPPAPTALPGPSPRPNPTPTPTSLTNASLTAHLKLSAILSCPEPGQKEWIELHWDSADTGTLTGWWLEDSSGSIFTFNNYTLEPNYFHTIQLASARLNNSGDLISLRSNDATLIWSYEIPPCNSRESFFVLDEQLVSTANLAHTTTSTTATTASKSSRLASASAVLAQPTDPSFGSVLGTTTSTNQSPSATTSFPLKLPYKKITHPSKIPTLSSTPSRDQKLPTPQTATTHIASLSWQLQQLKFALISGILGSSAFCLFGGWQLLIYAHKTQFFNLFFENT